MNSTVDIKIPGYRIEKMIGKGGMATVYLATQLSLGRHVALKILNDPETPQFFERFFLEGRCISRLYQANLVTVYDIGQGDGFYYIAMEYIPGGDLKDRIRQGIKPGAALKVIARLAICLNYVHNEGVLHRDIKPSNVLFRNDGSPVLTDFGIAKLIQADNDLTLTGTVLGSPHYLSPEQARGTQKLDGRSDLYSLGIILFEMLTGKKPFSAESFAATLMAHLKNPVPPLPDEHKNLQPLLNKLLAKKREARFQTGDDLAKIIQEIRAQLKNSSKTSQNSTRNWLRLPRSVLIPSAIVSVLAIAALPFIWSQSTDLEAIALKPTPEPEPVLETIKPLPPKLMAVDLESTITEGTTASIQTGDSEQPVPLTETAEEPHSDPLSDLLTRAEDQLKKNHLSYPAGDSARDLYWEALKLDPGNQTAKRGLDQVANRYLLFAKNQIKRGDKKKARRSTDQGLKIRPKNSELLQLKDELTAVIKPSKPKVEPILEPVIAPPKKEKPKETFDWNAVNPDHG